MLDFRMDTFLAVCRHRNYTRAAEELNITQPAVTQHIQYLQSYYGVKLFSYQNKRLALTEEGELLRNAALCMLHDEEKLKRDVKDLRLGRRSIRFGATLTIGEYLLPERLAAYMKRNPRVDVHMLVENTQILLRMINDGELDFAVVEGYFRKSEYDYIIWSQEPYVCVCAAATSSTAPGTRSSRRSSWTGWSSTPSAWWPRISSGTRPSTAPTSTSSPWPCTTRPALRLNPPSHSYPKQQERLPHPRQPLLLVTGGR